MSKPLEPAVIPDVTPSPDAAEPTCGYIKEDDESGSRGDETWGFVVV